MWQTVWWVHGRQFGGYVADSVQDSKKLKASLPALLSVLDFEREKIYRFLV
jgi:hypothetical protein